MQASLWKLHSTIHFRRAVFCSKVALLKKKYKMQQHYDSNSNNNNNNNNNKQHTS